MKLTLAIFTLSLISLSHAKACNQYELIKINEAGLGNITSQQRLELAKCYDGCKLVETSDATDTAIQSKIIRIYMSQGRKAYLIELTTNDKDSSEKVIELLMPESLSLAGYTYSASTKINGKTAKIKVAQHMRALTSGSITLQQPDEFFVDVRLSNGPVVEINEVQLGLAIENKTFHQVCQSYRE